MTASPFPVARQISEALQILLMFSQACTGNLASSLRIIRKNNDLLVISAIFIKKLGASGEGVKIVC